MVASCIFIRGIIVCEGDIFSIVCAADITYVLGNDADEETITDESDSQVNQWSKHHMDKAPLEKIYRRSSITAQKIINFWNKHDSENIRNWMIRRDPPYEMTALYMLSMNPYASAYVIEALLVSNMETVSCYDRQSRESPNYA